MTLETLTRIFHALLILDVILIVIVLLGWLRPKFRRLRFRRWRSERRDCLFAPRRYAEFRKGGAE